MFRRRSRNFSRFRGRFKRRGRSGYVHAGGRWQRAQWCQSFGLTASGGSTTTAWTDLLGIDNHIFNQTDTAGSLMTQIARYVEVRAFQWDFSVIYRPLSNAAGVQLTDWIFLGFCVDRKDADNFPASSTVYEPFVTQLPIERFSLAGADNIGQGDLQTPTRWLRKKRTAFQAGDLNGAATTYSSNGGHNTWSGRYRRSFKLSDENCFAWVWGINSLAAEGTPASYTIFSAGDIWYRVGFGR